jgi:hypothetical protein
MDVRNTVSDNNLYEQWIAKSTAAEKLWRRFFCIENLVRRNACYCRKNLKLDRTLQLTMLKCAIV